MEDQLRDLIQQRGHIKAALTRFKRFVDASGRTAPINSLRLRYQENEKLLARFDNIQCQIESRVENTEVESIHAEERELFENTYFDVMAQVNTYLEGNLPTRTTAAGSPSSGVFTAVDNSTPPLPTISLPEFSGDPDTWLRFRDTFESLVHKNEQLSDIKRFHYLNSALKGDAARVIESLGVTDANYRIAWKTISERYEDPKELTYHHARSLLRLPNVNSLTYNSLRTFIDKIKNHLHALKILNEPVEGWDTMLILILTPKLDASTYTQWETKLLSIPGKPKIDQFLAFLEGQATLIKRIASNKPGSKSVPSGKPADSGKSRRRSEILTSHVTSNQFKCPLCKGNHILSRCEALKTMSQSSRFECVRQIQCCYNCLHQGHTAQNCTRGTCRKCGKRHHTLLHRDNGPSIASNSTVPLVSTSSPPIPSSGVSPNSLVAPAVNETSSALLSTAIVLVKDQSGKLHECRALLDVGSQANFITEDLFRILQLPASDVSKTVGGLSCITNKVSKRVSLRIQSHCTNFSAKLSCFVLKDITNDMPNIPIPDYLHKLIPSQLRLADPKFYKAGRIDLLIGAGLFWQLLCVGQRKAGIRELVWQKTQLGWVLGGTLHWPVEGHNRNTCLTVSNKELNQGNARLWELDSVHANSTSSGSCPVEAHLQNHVYRDDTGRYVLAIPFNEQLGNLGHSREQAYRLFINLERKFYKQPQLKQQHIQVMRDYELLGHMTNVTHEADQTTVNIYNYSSYYRLIRITAWCLKVTRKAQPQSKPSFPTITVEEFQIAEIKILKLVQDSSFSYEKGVLLSNGTLEGRNSLASSNPFLDKAGIIRVGGRLSLASVPYNKKHPITLPAEKHLTRVIGEQRLTYEELYTVLTQIEACLNSRPLHPISSEPHDLEPLTPGHFLIGTALTAISKRDLISTQSNRLNRYQMLQQMVQQFWKRWFKEHLHNLQQRCKWRTQPSRPPEVRSLVVIQEDNLPPLRSRLGRIVDLHPGPDGIVRVVSVQVPEGAMKRPLSRICMLPNCDNNE